MTGGYSRSVGPRGPGGPGAVPATGSVVVASPTYVAIMMERPSRGGSLKRVGKYGDIGEWIRCRARSRLARMAKSAPSIPRDPGRQRLRRGPRGARGTRRVARGRLLGVRQNPLDERRVLDAHDHPQLPAAAPAALDVDREHGLEPLRLIATCFDTGRSGVSAGRAPRFRPTGVAVVSTRWSTSTFMRRRCGLAEYEHWDCDRPSACSH
jgi:hypothetical protein